MLHNTVNLSICTWKHTVYLCLPFVMFQSFFPLVFMSRWSSWSCFSVSQPVWSVGCIESATESPRGWYQSQTVTNSQRRISQNLYKVWCSQFCWPCSARLEVLMQPRLCKTSLWCDRSWSFLLCLRSKFGLYLMSCLTWLHLRATSWRKAESHTIQSWPRWALKCSAQP